jgi:hypothetical protein
MKSETFSGNKNFILKILPYSLIILNGVIEGTILKLPSFTEPTKSQSFFGTDLNTWQQEQYPQHQAIRASPTRSIVVFPPESC